jgi:uncharacterized protein (TIRG00374 family)
MSMKLRENLWQFLILGLAVSLALSIYADFDELVRAFGLFDWWLFPLVLGLTVGNQLLRFLKWEYLLREIDITLPLSTSIHIFGSGLVMILTPGKLGEVWKSWLIRDHDGTSISTTMPVIVTERITDLLAVAIISLLGVIAFDRSPLFLLVLLVPLSGGVLILQHKQVCYRLLDRLNRIPIVGQRVEAAKNLYMNSRELLSLRPLGVTTAVSIFSWGLECIGMWLVLRGFGADVELLVAAFVFAVSSILGALSLLPGGLGVTEGSMTGLLLVFEVNRATAAGSTLIIRAATLWFIAGAALVVYLSYKRHTSKGIPDSDGESSA